MKIKPTIKVYEDAPRRAKAKPTGRALAVVGEPSRQAASGGLDGGSRIERETATWTPRQGPIDTLILPGKNLADARSRDMAINDGYAHGAQNTHRDSIIGAQFLLNLQPATNVLRTSGYAFDEVWAEEFQTITEETFGLLAESMSAWLDYGGAMTFTEMLRLIVGSFVVTGETFMAGEWLNKDPSRPLSTAINIVSAARVTNPEGQADSETLRRGVRYDARGRAVGYWVRKRLPQEGLLGITGPEMFTWRFIPATKPWGRQQMLHIYERKEAGQSRGVADMVSALKHMRMTKMFSEMVLQNMVVNASYAAALETELPPAQAYAVMGGDSAEDNFESLMGSYMTILKEFFGSANVTLDGVKIPALPPGTKLNARALGTGGGLGTTFEDSLHRHVAAGLGLSFEEYTHNFSKTSYSSARASGQKMARFMRSRKKSVAERAANFVFQLAFEEMFAKGMVPMPSGVGRDFFYQPLMKEALTRASWIGAGAGQIDELKETQAAILKIKSGLSTYEAEAARLGSDFRQIFKQRAREEAMIEELGLPISLDTQKAGAKDRQNVMSDDPAADKQEADTEDDTEGGGEE